MVRTVIKLAIVGLIAHAMWRIAPVYLDYVRFKDRVGELAQFAGQRSENEVHQLVLDIAADVGVPVTPDAVTVRRERDRTVVNATYVEAVEVLPSYTYPWTFRLSVDRWVVRPPTASDYIPQR